MQADFVRFPNYHSFSDVYIDVNPSRERKPPQDCNVCYDHLDLSHEKDQIDIEAMDEAIEEMEKDQGEKEEVSSAEKESSEIFSELPVGIYSHPDGYHPLHSPCLKRWAAFRDTCPTCRKIIPLKTLHELRRIDDPQDLNNITWIFIAVFCGAMTAYVFADTRHQAPSLILEGAGVGLLCTVGTSNLLDTRIRDAAISVIGGMVPIIIDITIAQQIRTASAATRLVIFTFTSFTMLNITGLTAGISAIIGVPSSILGMGTILIGQILGFNDSRG